MQKFKVLAVLLTVSSLSGCGTDSPSEVAASYHDARCSVETVDDLTALNTYLTPEFQDKPASEILRHYKRGLLKICSKPFEVIDVKIDGDSATVINNSILNLMRMKKIDGEWKVEWY